MSIVLDEFTENMIDTWTELTVDFCHVKGKKPQEDDAFKVVMKFTTFSDGYLKLDNIGKIFLLKKYSIVSLTFFNVLGPCSLLYGLERSMNLASSNKRRCYKTFKRAGKYQEVLLFLSNRYLNPIAAVGHEHL